MRSALESQFRVKDVDEVIHTTERPFCADPTCPCGVGKFIAGGVVVESVLSWLEARGVVIQRGPVNIIQLPEGAIVEKGRHSWEYVVSFYDEDGAEADRRLYIDLDVDATVTFIGFQGR